jgi:hypothetical protein
VQTDVFAVDQVHSLSELPGQKIAVVGVGGGSDGIQAAQIGMLMQKTGKELVCAVSIRSQKKNVENYHKQLANNVYHIHGKTQADGRFHEPLLADEINMLLVMDDDQLKDRVMESIAAFGQVDTVFLVDTGGDALYSKQDAVGADTTPDQDLKVLSEFSSGYPDTQFYTMIIAPGIDSPPQGPERLRQGKAVCYALSKEETTQVLSNYQRWKLDGSTDELIGKTPLAWQAALRDEFGENILPIPKANVESKINPWNPLVYVQPSMANIFVMKLEDHLKLIS